MVITSNVPEDFSTIQDAIDYLDTQSLDESNRGIVLVNDNIVEGNISLKSFITIKGRGKEYTKISSTNPIFLIGENDCIIEDLTIASTAAAACVQIYANDITISKCNIESTNNTGVSILSNSTAVVIENCNVKGKTYGIYSEGLINLIKDSSIKNTTASGTDKYAIYVTYPTETEYVLLSLQNSRFYGAQGASPSTEGIPEAGSPAMYLARANAHTEVVLSGLFLAGNYAYAIDGVKGAILDFNGGFYGTRVNTSNITVNENQPSAYIKDIPYQSYLSNGGFEVWSNGISVVPDGWNTDWEVAQDVGYLSKYSAVLSVLEEGTETKLFQEKEHPESFANKKLSIDCWTKVSSLVPDTITSKVRVRINGEIEGEISNTSTDWEKIELTVDVPSNINSLVIELVGISVAGPGEAFFDNIMAVIGIAPADYRPQTSIGPDGLSAKSVLPLKIADNPYPNILGNGGFETWLTDTVADFWIKETSGSGTVSKNTDTQFVKSGSTSIQLTKVLNTDVVILKQKIEVCSQFQNKPISVSIWTYVSASGQAKMTIYDDSASQNVQNSAEEGWELLNISNFVPTSGSVWIVLENVLSISGNVYFDDAMLSLTRESTDFIVNPDKVIVKDLIVENEIKFKEGNLSAGTTEGIGLKDSTGNLGVWVKDGGDVGIGTSDPSSKLDVIGNDGSVNNSAPDVLNVLGGTGGDGNTKGGDIKLTAGVGGANPSAQAGVGGNILLSGGTGGTGDISGKGGDVKIQGGSSPVEPGNVLLAYEGGKVGIGVINPTKTLDVAGEIKSTVDNTEFYMVPQGAIIMWSGAINSIPTGWALCNGSNGTPDLRDKFIVGAGNSYNVADTGGSTTMAHTHTGPNHNHEAFWADGSYQVWGYKSDGSLQDHQLWFYGTKYNVTSGNTDAYKAYGGMNSTHYYTTMAGNGITGAASNTENRPPYYALAYIMKL
ncbi:MAG: right-handed parallel beta-helix repeat-containing protein [Elusimicrobiota bacterium]